MFTREDFFSYFDQIQVIERDMCVAYLDMESKVEHAYYKKALKWLAKEEKGHEELIMDLKKKFVSDHRV